MTQVLFSYDLVSAPDGRLIRAKKDRRGNIVVYPKSIEMDYADVQQGVSQYLRCFREFVDAGYKTLYVHRPLLNGEEVAAWAKANGFATTLLPLDMHVTIAFSRDKVRWEEFTPQAHQVSVFAGERFLDRLGDNGEAVVLRFVSVELEHRWQQFKAGGAKWDYPTFKPHVTLTYEGEALDLDAITPFEGALIFGPEVFSEIDDDRADVVAEKDFDESEHPRDEDGKFAFGGGGGSEDSGSGGGGGGSSKTPDEVVSSARSGVARGSKQAQDNGVKPLVGSIGHPSLISTRLASAKGIDQSVFRQPSIAAMKENPTNFNKDMALFKNINAYPNLRAEEAKGSADSIARAVVDHAKENLKFLYDNAPTEVRDHGKFWYDGARTLVNEKADKYKLNDASVTGVYAALSPQKLWDMNVYLADRVIDIHQTQQNTEWSKKMDATAKAIWKTERNKKVLDLVQGKKLSELKTPVEKALWIRTYDEAYSDRHFRSISPLGVRGEYVKNKDGKLSTAAWQSLPSVTNAVRSLEANGDSATISASMGAQHKVRSFYNNILDPYSKNDDVTIDTHAVGAALLRPLTGSDAAVLHSMGLGPDQAKKPEGWEAATGSVKTGVQGLYGVYATAYRELAHDLKIEPRQLQSITWEAKRKLFDRSLKETEASAIESTWQDYHAGKISLKDTQKKIVELAGGF